MHKPMWLPLVAMSLSSSPPPQTTTAQPPNSAEGNKGIVVASFEKWKAGTGGPFDLLAEDATWTIVGNSVASRTYASRQEFLREVIQPFNARMSKPLVPTIRKAYSDGDTVIVFFDAAGTARDGKEYRNTYAWFLDFRNGKIINAVAFFDTIEFDDFWKRVKPAP